MPTITIRELDAHGDAQEVAWVHIDGDQVTIKDPEGHLDTSVPTPVIDDLGRGDRRRVRFEEDQKLEPALPAARALPAGHSRLSPRQGGDVSPRCDACTARARHV